MIYYYTLLSGGLLSFESSDLPHAFKETLVVDKGFTFLLIFSKIDFDVSISSRDLPHCL